jgi:hypothetical protein
MSSLSVILVLQASVSLRLFLPRALLFDPTLSRGFTLSGEARNRAKEGQDEAVGFPRGEL